MCVGWHRDPGSLLGLLSKFPPATAVSVHVPALSLWLLYKFPIIARSAAAHLGPEYTTLGQGQLSINVWWVLCVLDGAGAQAVKDQQANTDPCDTLRDIAACPGNSGLTTTVFPKVHSLH